MFTLRQAAIPLLLLAANSVAETYNTQWQYPLQGFVLGTEITDLQGDGQKEVLVMDSEGNLYVLNADGTLNWRVATNGYGSGSPGSADLDGDGSKEIVVATADSVFAYTASGALLWQASVHIDWGDTNFAPSFYDLVGDATLDVVTVDVDGIITAINGATGVIAWQYASGSSFDGTAVIADLDGDGIVEIIAHDYDNSAYALDPTGKVLWQTDVGDYADYSSPVVADIDNDGDLEIVITGGSGYIVAVDHAGNVLWQYDAFLSHGENFNFSAPAVGDVDGDGRPEIIAVGSSSGTLFVLDAKGNEEWIDSVALEDETGSWLAPSLADIDGDGILEIIAGSYSTVYALNADTKTRETVFDTGSDLYPQVLIDDLQGDGLADFVIPDWSAWSITVVSGSGSLGAAWPAYMRNSERVGAVPIPDYDSDSVPNALDNCPHNYNPDQKDLDVDGVGDVCDASLDAARATLNIISQLANMPPASEKSKKSKKSADKIDDAVKELNKAAQKFERDPSDSKDALGELKDGTKKMEEALDKGYPEVDALILLMEDVAAIARTVALEAIDASEDAGDRNKALEKLAEGDEKLAEGKYEDAVEKYKKALSEVF